MIPNISINLISNKKVEFIDNSSYLNNEDYDIAFDLKLKDAEVIHILSLNDLEGNNKILLKRTLENDSTIYEFNEDGWYTILQIVIPKRSWYDSLTDSIRQLLQDDIILFIDDGIIYREWIIDDNIKYYKLGYNPITEEEDSYEDAFNLLLEVNDNSELFSNITFYKKEYDFFVTGNLYECYVNLCKLLLNCDYVKCNKKIDLSSVFKRDLIWMTYNVILYYIMDKNYAKALEVLLRIRSNCGDICNNSKNNKFNYGCGCSKGKNNI